MCIYIYILCVYIIKYNFYDNVTFDIIFKLLIDLNLSKKNVCVYNQLKI